MCQNIKNVLIDGFKYIGNDITSKFKTLEILRIKVFYFIVKKKKLQG